MNCCTNTCVDRATAAECACKLLCHCSAPQLATQHSVVLLAATIAPFALYQQVYCGLQVHSCLTMRHAASRLGLVRLSGVFQIQQNDCLKHFADTAGVCIASGCCVHLNRSDKPPAQNLQTQPDTIQTYLSLTTFLDHSHWWIGGGQKRCSISAAYLGLDISTKSLLSNCTLH